MYSIMLTDYVSATQPLRPNSTQISSCRS